jgi:uncharacterized membrane protein
MSALQLVLLVLLVVLIAAAIVVFVRPQRSGVASGPRDSYQLFGPGVRDDDRYWLAGGFFYSNPDDPSLFVINRWALGITPNVAHPLSVRIAIGFLIAVALVPVLLMLLVPGHGTAGGCHPFSGCHQ